MFSLILSAVFLFISLLQSYGQDYERPRLEFCPQFRDAELYCDFAENKVKSKIPEDMASAAIDSLDEGLFKRFAGTALSNPSKIAVEVTALVLTPSPVNIGEDDWVINELETGRHELRCMSRDKFQRVVRDVGINTAQHANDFAASLRGGLAQGVNYRKWAVELRQEVLRRRAIRGARQSGGSYMPNENDRLLNCEIEKLKRRIPRSQPRAVSADTDLSCDEYRLGNASNNACTSFMLTKKCDTNQWQQIVNIYQASQATSLSEFAAKINCPELLD
jgi:hypothetical protein